MYVCLAVCVYVRIQEKQKLPRPDFNLFNILENRKLSKKDTYACFIDFKKASDSIPRDKLWQKLERIGSNGDFLETTGRLYLKTQYSVCFNNDRYESMYKTRKGGC